ncbi:hypothetical protein NW762_013986 [Fusarium torreyae]|uniref:Zn(2)-C6 fungal-type domain-containing protein n=1 Tax=Fusarium torreyae TaxID=1237075 RepID=A0A9W8RL30_9HYPO|nr:hypothetical protein NW762_013986 [Fusarium torreyae]
MRQGIERVKTACLTCKVRKVKCDETWPACHRCTSTGRKCDGYRQKQNPRDRPNPRALLPRGAPSTQSLLPVTERRALQYFNRVISPRLASARDGYFWTHLVMQLSESEPVVKHTILSISSMFESAETKKLAPYPKMFALHHYTAAIDRLKSIHDEPLVLIVCILFIAVEYLRANNKIAIQHCQHGLAIMDKCGNPWARQYLLPIFRRLTAVPMLFGPEDVDADRMPPLSYMIPSKFYCMEDAQYTMDDIFNRAVRLCYLEHRRVSVDTSEERNLIFSHLETWQTLFEGLHIDTSSPLYRAQESSLFMRIELCRLGFSADYDADEDTDSFRSILQLVIRLSRDSHLHAPQSTFELAYTPMLFFIIMKCPDLEVRLTALRLMKKFESPKEGLCENEQMLDTSRKIIQQENGLVLDSLDHCDKTTFEISFRDEHALTAPS